MTFKTRIATASVCAAVLVTGAVLAQPVAPVVHNARRHEERHPEMRQALRHLRAAQATLAKSAQDFDGHRARAAQLTQQAIDEVEAALKSDRH